MYTTEQIEKHKQQIDKELAAYSNEKRSQVKKEILYIWPSDRELTDLIALRKKEFDLEASPEEINEVFKDFHL